MAATEPVQEENPGRVLESISAKLLVVKARRAEIKAEDKDLVKEEDELKLQLMEAMDAVGITLFRANGHTISKTSRKVPTIADFDTFGDWFRSEIEQHPEYMALFERRISAPMYRELLEERKDDPIPGLETFERWNISTRKL